MPFGAVIGGALGLAGSLFGEDNTSSPTATSTNEPWAPTVPYLEGILGDASNLYSQGAFAPLPNELQYLGLENQLGYAEDVLPELIGATQESWLSGLDPGMDPYVWDMINAAQYDMIQQYNREILPSIADASLSTGGYGGSRQGVAEGIAAEGLSEGLADLQTQLLSDAYGQGLAQQQAAWANAPSMLGLGYLPGETQESIGQTYQGYAALPAANLQGYSNLITPIAGQGYTTEGLNPYYVDPISGAVSGALTGAGLVDEFGWGSSGTPDYSDPSYDPFSGHTSSAWGTIGSWFS